MINMEMEPVGESVSGYDKEMANYFRATSISLSDALEDVINYVDTEISKEHGLHIRNMLYHKYGLVLCNIGKKDDK